MGGTCNNTGGAAVSTGLSSPTQRGLRRSILPARKNVFSTSKRKAACRVQGGRRPYWVHPLLPFSLPRSKVRTAKGPRVCPGKGPRKHHRHDAHEALQPPPPDRTGRHEPTLSLPLLTADMGSACPRLDLLLPVTAARALQPLKRTVNSSHETNPNPGSRVWSFPFCVNIFLCPGKAPACRLPT